MGNCFLLVWLCQLVWSLQHQEFLALELGELLVVLEVITPPPVEENGVRRSRRTTVGHHSNVHHLPRAVGEEVPDV